MSASIGETPKSRRHLNDVPSDADAAAARFRCAAYQCTMTGAYCARQCLHASQTHAGNRDACLGCDAGTARVRLLDVGPLTCWVYVDNHGTRCGKDLAYGKSVCAYHWAHGSGARGTARDRVTIPGHDRILSDDASVAKTEKARRERDAIRKRDARAKLKGERQFREMTEGEKVRARTCQECGNTVRSMGYGASRSDWKWCNDCKNIARNRLRCLHMPRTMDYVESYLSTPAADRAMKFSSVKTTCPYCGGRAIKPKDGGELMCAKCRKSARRRMAFTPMPQYPDGVESHDEA